MKKTRFYWKYNSFFYFTNKLQKQNSTHILYAYIWDFNIIFVTTIQSPLNSGYLWYLFCCFTYQTDIILPLHTYNMIMLIEHIYSKIKLWCIIMLMCHEYSFEYVESWKAPTHYFSIILFLFVIWPLIFCNLGFHHITNYTDNVIEIIHLLLLYFSYILSKKSSAFIFCSISKRSIF